MRSGGPEPALAQGQTAHCQCNTGTHSCKRKCSVAEQPCNRTETAAQVKGNGYDCRSRPFRRSRSIRPSLAKRLARIRKRPIAAALGGLHNAAESHCRVARHRTRSVSSAAPTHATGVRERRCDADRFRVLTTSRWSLRKAFSSLRGTTANTNGSMSASFIVTDTRMTSLRNARLHRPTVPSAKRLHKVNARD